MLTVVRGVGLVLTAVLLGASIFTIASVIRLTSYLYRDEISVMRLVGATEFYIRGPFYVEGLLQGLLGAVVALGGLFAVHLTLQPRLERSLVASVLAERFLSPLEIAALLGSAPSPGSPARWFRSARARGERELGEALQLRRKKESAPRSPAGHDRERSRPTGPGSAAESDDDHRAPVLRPAVGRLVRGDRLGAAAALGRDPARVDAVPRHQVRDAPLRRAARRAAGCRRRRPSCRRSR